MTWVDGLWVPVELLEIFLRERGARAGPGSSASMVPAPLVPPRSLCGGVVGPYVPPWKPPPPTPPRGRGPTTQTPKAQPPKAPPTAQQRAEYTALLLAHPETGWRRIAYRVDVDRGVAGVAVAPPDTAVSSLGAAAASRDAYHFVALEVELGFRDAEQGQDSQVVIEQATVSSASGESEEVMVWAPSPEDGTTEVFNIFGQGKGGSRKGKDLPAPGEP